MIKLATFLLFLSSVGLFAQPRINHEVGYLFDVEGALVFKYYDGLYSTEQAPFYTIDPADHFVSGCLIYSDFRKETGFIKLKKGKDKLLFKPTLNQEAVKTDKKQLAALELMGKPYRLRRSDEFNEFSSFGDWVVLKRVGQNLNLEFEVQNLKEQEQKIFKDRFVKNNFYEDDFYAFFEPYFPLTAYSAREKKASYLKMETLMWLIELEYHCKTEQLIQCDDFLNKTKSNPTYYLRIDSIENHTYHLSYLWSNKKTAYSLSLKMAKGGLLKRVGSMKLCNTEGKPYKVFKYINGRLVSTHLLHSNGQVMEARPSAFQDSVRLTIYDRLGRKVLDEKGNGKLSFYDEIGGRLIENHYRDFQRYCAFSINPSGDTVYLLAEQQADYIFFNKYAMKLEKMLSEVGYDPEFNDLKVGYLFYECLIDQEGKVTALKLKRSLNPALDEKLSQTLKVFLSNNEVFKPAMHENKAVSQLLLLPIKVRFNELHIDLKERTNGYFPFIYYYPGMFGGY